MYSSEKLSRPCYFSGHLETKKIKFLPPCLGLRNGTISLTATTYRKRTFCKWPFCFSVKYCFKNSTVRDNYPNFLTQRDHYWARNARYQFCFLFPATDHPAWSCMVVTKSSLKWHKLGQVLIALTQWAFSRRRPPPVRDHVFVHYGGRGVAYERVDYNLKS